MSVSIQCPQNKEACFQKHSWHVHFSLMFLSFSIFYASSCPIQHVPAESVRSAGEISKALELSHSSTMLTGGQLVVLFRVRLLGCVSVWPRQLVRSSAELTTGEISLAFGHAMEVCLSRRLHVFIDCDCWGTYSGYQSHATLSRKTSRQNLSFGGRQSSPPPCRFT